MNLELVILAVLAEAAGYLLPLKTVIASVRLRSNPPPKDAEILKALAALDGKGHVLRVENADTGAKYRLADDGKARLVQAGLA